MTSWRYLHEDDVSPDYGLAVDEALALAAGDGSSVATLRLYTYRSHCALVGRFQTIENEIRLNYCRANSIPLNRRPTGGGAIIMGEDQLGVALTMPGSRSSTYAEIRSLMKRFSHGVVSALRHLKVQAEFRGKNDLEVEGRKIAGLGIHRTDNGGLLFHASVLVDLDVALMLRVLNTPFEKISDKEIRTVSARVTTVRRESGTELTVDEVRSQVLKGYKDVFEAEIQSARMTAAEEETADRLQRAKYRRDDWIFQKIDTPDSAGNVKTRTPGGLLDVRVVTAGPTIKAAYIGGDFFASERALADLEGSLRWHSGKSEAIRRTVNRVYLRWRDDLSAIPIESLCYAIEEAVREAARPKTEAASDPYGCFVAPRRAHA